MNILREARVIRGGERKIIAHCPRAGRESQGAFGRYVDRIGFKFLDAIDHIAFRQDGKSDIRIRWAGNGFKFQRRQNVNRVAHFFQVHGALI